MIKSGISVFGSRTARAIAHVAHAGLIRRPKRAVNQITKRDLEVLQEHPDRVDSQMSSANLGPARELLKGVPYLRGRRAVITMSRFSPDAYSYAEKVAARVILIDGATLASLLVEHNIGAQDSETFVLKRVDEDFFEGV